MRFWVFVPFIPFQIAGAWWFGYSLNNGWSWVQVAIAYGMCNFGSAPLQSLALTYILDAYNGESCESCWRDAKLIVLRNRRRCLDSCQLLPVHAVHDFCLCIESLDRRHGSGQRFQHHGSHCADCPIVRGILHLAWQAFTGEDGESLQLLCRPTV